MSHEELAKMTDALRASEELRENLHLELDELTDQPEMGVEAAYHQEMLMEAGPGICLNLFVKLNDPKYEDAGQMLEKVFGKSFGNPG